MKSPKVASAAQITAFVPGRLVMAAIFLLAESLTAFGQANRVSQIPQTPLRTLFTNNPYALYVISNLQAEPQPELTVPEVSRTNSGPMGTYWTFKNTPVPLPFDLFPGLPAYQINTNEYLIDDRSVDYLALAAQQRAEAEAEGLTNQTITPYSIDTNGLWIQVPTNSLATNGYFCANLMNTIQGQPYDVLTTPSLTAPNWATEQIVTGAAGNVTPVQMPMNNRASLFLRARPSVSYSFYLITQPLSQYYFDKDTVTVSVETGGNSNLTFQWTWDGYPIVGATNSVSPS